MSFDDLALESGDICSLDVPGLGYPLELPWVSLPAAGGRIRIASLNLVGLTRVNADLGRLLAGRLRPVIAGKPRVGLLTAVEKGLQLAQVVSQELSLPRIAVAHNRVKPHMEPKRRPIVQVGADSITSGDKFLVLYERDLNHLAACTDGVILLDDVISTGGTMLALERLVAETSRRAGLPRPLPVLARACAAVEGRPDLADLVYLAVLPSPQAAPARS